MLNIEPISLAGPYASLVPLAMEHANALGKAAIDGNVCKLWYTDVPGPETIEDNIQMRLSRQAEGTMLPFTVLSPEGIPVGMTTFANIDRVTPRVEIGYTWYAKSFQRSSLNTQCKRLMLGQAFDQWQCTAVEFRTASFNRASRAAIERIGGKLDGILRNHRHYANGELRDTCVYSITAAEWGAVRAHLDAMLATPMAVAT